MQMHTCPHCGAQNTLHYYTTRCTTEHHRVQRIDGRLLVVDQGCIDDITDSSRLQCSECDWTDTRVSEEFDQVVEEGEEGEEPVEVPAEPVHRMATDSDYDALVAAMRPWPEDEETRRSKS